MGALLRKFGASIAKYPLIIQLLIVLGILWAINFIVDWFFGSGSIPWWRWSMWEHWRYLTEGKKPGE